jgi:hypothetical protein
MVSAAVVLPRATVPPSAEAPSLLPKTPKVERRVFLEKAFWDQLSEAAEFHTDAFRAIERGKDEKAIEETVSRNDLIERFLIWALDQFWAAKGGEPKDAADREKKVKAFARELKAKIDAANAADAQR